MEICPVGRMLDTQFISSSNIIGPYFWLP